jgi:adenylate cyclase
MFIRSDVSLDAEGRWHKLLTEGHRPLRVAHMLFRHLPSPPRCKVCYNPFGGIGGKVVGIVGFARSRKNPNLCTACCDALPPGGSEVDIAVLFADVRGSTSIGERLEPAAYAALMNDFYRATTEMLIRHDAIIDKLIGDEVMALFIPGICGPDYRRRGAEAAIALVEAVGQSRSSEPIPIGVAVNSGLTYVGNVGSEGVVDFTALGDTVNTASRLASCASSGEVLLSDSVYADIAGDLPDLETRALTLRGKTAPVAVHVVRPSKPSARNSKQAGE